MLMKTGLLLALLGSVSTSSMAQKNNGEVSVDFTGNFQSNTSGQGITDGPSYSGGFLASYRYHFTDWGAVEVNYSRTRYTQFYSGAGNIISSWTQATAQEATFAFVAHFWDHFNGRLRPFAEVGTGGIQWSPVAAGSVGGPFSQNRPVFLFGGGFDWHWFGRFSLRAGYRGLLYTAPDFNVNGQFTNSRTQMKEPYAGIVFRF